MRVGGNGENNKESEETPQHHQAVHTEAGLYQAFSTLPRVEGIEVASAESREEEEGEGKEKGP